MAYSSLQLKASVAFLILYFLVFDCSSSPLYTNSTNSKITPMNGTINVHYQQSLSYDIKEYISTNKTSHGAEAKPQSYINTRQNEVTFSMDEETSLMNHVNNNLATDNTHNSRRFSRSAQTTSWCMLGARPNISHEIQKWISYVASCADKSSSECHNSCSVNSTERNNYLKIDMLQWGEWHVTAACPFTISTDGSYVTAVCQNVGQAECQNGNHRHLSSRIHGCHQVYYTHIPHSLCHHPVGCVYATRKSVKGRAQPTPRSVQK